jgi:NADH-quinone oxidoreductase subunit E
MSMPSKPEILTAETDRIEGMNESLNRTMPKEMASAINLMAHPVAGIAAMSAVGLGMASHMFGVWIGSLSGAIEASQAMLKTVAEAGNHGEAEKAEVQPKQPSARVRATAKTLMAEAQSFAAEAVKVPDIVPPVATVKPEGKSRRKPAGETVLKASEARPQALEKPAIADDFKAIAGVGPKLETVLNGLGIWTYAQIAGWTPGNVAWVEDHLGFKDRVQRDGWIAQAAALAAAAEKR